MGRRNGRVPWPARVARVAKRWSVGLREAAELVDGEPMPLAVLSDLLPEIEQHDFLEHVHDTVERYDRERKSGGKPRAPFGRDLMRWYHALQHEAAAGAPGAGRPRRIVVVEETGLEPLFDG